MRESVEVVSVVQLWTVRHVVVTHESPADAINMSTIASFSDHNQAEFKLADSLMPMTARCQHQDSQRATR